MNLKKSLIISIFSFMGIFMILNNSNLQADYSSDIPFSKIPSGTTKYGFSDTPYSHILGGNTYELSRFKSSDINLSKPFLKNENSKLDLRFDFGVDSKYGGDNQNLEFRTEFSEGLERKINNVVFSPKFLFTTIKQNKYKDSNQSTVWTTKFRHVLNSYHFGKSIISIDLNDNFISKDDKIFVYIKNDSEKSNPFYPNYEALRILGYDDFGKDYNEDLLDEIKKKAIDRLNKEKIKLLDEVSKITYDPNNSENNLSIKNNINNKINEVYNEYEKKINNQDISNTDAKENIYGLTEDGISKMVDASKHEIYDKESHKPSIDRSLNSGDKSVYGTGLQGDEIIIRDSYNNFLGSSHVEKNKRYNVSLNRSLQSGEKIIAESSNDNKLSDTTSTYVNNYLTNLTVDRLLDNQDIPLDPNPNTITLRVENVKGYPSDRYLIFSFDEDTGNYYCTDLSNNKILSRKKLTSDWQKIGFDDKISSQFESNKFWVNTNNNGNILLDKYNYENKLYSKYYSYFSTEATVNYVEKQNIKVNYLDSETKKEIVDNENYKRYGGQKYYVSNPPEYLGKDYHYEKSDNKAGMIRNKDINVNFYYKFNKNMHKVSIEDLYDGNEDVKGMGIAGDKIVIKDNNYNVLGYSYVDNKGQYSVKLNRKVKTSEKIIAEPYAKTNKGISTNTVVKGNLYFEPQDIFYNDSYRNSENYFSSLIGSDDKLAAKIIDNRDFKSDLKISIEQTSENFYSDDKKNEIKGELYYYKNKRKESILNNPVNIYDNNTSNNIYWSENNQVLFKLKSNILNGVKYKTNIKWNLTQGYN